MQKVVMFTKDQPYGYTVDYQLQVYLDGHPDVSVRCVSLDHAENHRDRLLVVFDVKEEN